jgi:endo-1,4-beta-D-glucanase Y
MRTIVIAVAALAAAKVWTQDRYVRASMSEALIEAYRERAQAVCGREALKSGTSGTAIWTSSSPPEITIGSKVARVMIWDYDNPLWPVRYRNPHLVLTASAPRKLTCSYDVAVGVAFVQQH